MKQTQNIWENLILHGLVPPMKKGDVGMTKCFLSMGTRDELHYLKSEIIAMSRCLSVPDTTTTTSLPQEQASKTCMVSTVHFQQGGMNVVDM